MNGPIFKIGDKVKFIDSSKRFRRNKHEAAFDGLEIPLWAFRKNGVVTGFHRRYKFLGRFGYDKTKPIVRFDPPAPGEIPYHLFWTILEHSRTTFLIPNVLLKHYEVEGNHPLTQIFV